MNPIQLDFQKTALVIIDLQKGITRIPGAQGVIDKVAPIVRLFREKGGFITFVNVDFLDGRDRLTPITDQPAASGTPSLPADWAEFVPELGVTQGDHIVTKRNWGAFFGTDLDLQLRRRGIDTIVLCGISTNIGVEMTAREAFQHGYNQIFLTDGMMSTSQDEHDATCKFIFPRIGRSRTSEQFLAEVAENAAN
ncbi:isochorismatase family protein [Paenibacillus whitsoniae]|uniref:Isochorismatase family protein n=1 Tax=Paenibacillus whitsoniae TaxID=2496558 RepID=A0A430J527_9BACL|nr:isochorismatase family protein [Paenibacillus whitsoniae]RTE02564.1 isochorismatase family protein [Paenibacillus whitsoniae]